MLGDVWPVFQELERLKEMFARRIRLLAIDYWMRGEVREPVMRLVSVIEQNLLSATHWRIGWAKGWITGASPDLLLVLWVGGGVRL